MITGIIDYGAGNLRSVHKAVESLGAHAVLVTQPHELENLDALILPGVGAFGDCIDNLSQKKLIDPIRTWIREDRPYLGICLGYQILFDSSEESPGIEGLHAFPGKVVRFPKSDLKVPHMGWNEIQPTDPNSFLWKGLPTPAHLYFVHSFHPVPEDPSILAATCDYGGPFAAAVQKGSVVATQFHPEKSQDLGLRILQNFLEHIEQSLEPTSS